MLLEETVAQRHCARSPTASDGQRSVERQHKTARDRCSRAAMMRALLLLCTPMMQARRLYGIFPGDDYLQDYWGPVRFAFNETFHGAYAASFKMTEGACVGDLAQLNESVLPARFHGRVLPVGTCRTPDEILAEILAAGSISDVTVVGAARAGVGLGMYDALLSAGATVFFVYDAFITNTDPSSNFYWTFNPDVTTAAQLVAQETCRRYGENVEHRVLKLYGNEGAAFDVRVDAQLDWLALNCPGATITKTIEARANFDRQLAYELTKKALILDPSITTIIAANDRMLLGAQEAISETLSEAGASKLMVAGFDRVEAQLLSDDFAVASADQYLGVAGEGLWRAVKNVLSAVEDYAISSTSELQAHFSDTSYNGVLETRWENCTSEERSERCTFYTEPTTDTETSCQYADAEGQVVDALIHHTSYQAYVAAQTAYHSVPLPVTAHVSELEIQTMDTAGGSFHATAWVGLTWIDSRLKYDAKLFAGPIRVDIAQIWVPEMYISNLQTPEGLTTIKKLPVEVLPDGTATYSFRTVGEYGCDMEANLRSYPYDVHVCSLDVAVAESSEDIELCDGEILESVESCEGWENKIGKIDTAKRDQTLAFRFKIKRDWQFAVMSYVLVGWAFNLLGFTVFWIRAEGAGIDRSAVAITTILAAQFMMYEAKVSKIFTWLDWYFVIMLCYQFLAFVLLVKSSRNYRKQQATGGDEKFLIRVTAAQRKIRRRSKADDWVFWLFNLCFAGLETNSLDRTARRVLVPSFFVSQIIINFINPSAGFTSGLHTNKYIYKRAGFRAPLFWLNVVLLLFYGVLFLAAWFLGQFKADESAELRHFKNTEKRVQEAITRLETVFELHGADDIDVNVFFQKWRVITDKLRTKEETIKRRRMMRNYSSSPFSRDERPARHAVAVLPRPPRVRPPPFVLDDAIRWYWEEAPERITQHEVVRAPYWVPFDAGVVELLERALVAERVVVPINASYVADLRTMTQKNSASGYTRRLLREVSATDAFEEVDDAVPQVTRGGSVRELLRKLSSRK